MEKYGEKIPGGWFSEIDHCYRNEQGLIVPSSTQVFDILGMNNFDGIPPAVMEWKQTYGIAVHRATELNVFDRLDWDTCDEAVIPAVTGVEQYLNSLKYLPVAVEEQMIAKISGMEYGMTLDHRGSLLFKGQRRNAIIDLKTASKKSKTWEWQLGSYAAGVQGHHIGVILKVSQEGQVEPFWVVELEKAKREFGVLLAAANLKLNARLGKIKKHEED